MDLDCCEQRNFSERNRHTGKQRRKRERERGRESQKVGIRSACLGLLTERSLKVLSLPLFLSLSLCLTILTWIIVLI